jgi:PAS domain S-box-containing protein
VSELPVATLLSALDEGIVVMNAEAVILHCNRSAERILGLTAEEMAGRTTHDPRWQPIHEDGSPFPGDTHPVSVSLRTGQPQHNVIMGVRKPTGELTWISINSRALAYEGENKPYAVVASFTDITDQRRLEAQLRQSQKMEAVGRLAGGIAHDFNNVLGVILGYSDRLLKRLPEEDRKEIREVMKAAEHAATLTRQLLTFSRKQVVEPKILNPNAAVQEIDGMLRRIIGENIHLVTALKHRVGAVKADPGQLHQIILNLAINARDAMPNGGTLTIETADAELDAAYTAQHLEVRPGPYVMFAVSDTGHGMDRETQARIFEPFFTTKEPGKGTGLGLSTVYGIVKQSLGHVWVYSEPEQGTTFKVYLPRVAHSQENADSPIAREPLPKGTETILLVEDDPSLRELGREILAEQGYVVLEAGAGKVALELARGHAGPIHLLLTDLVMPGMSGRELAERVKQIHPEANVLFMSGYTDDALGSQGTLAQDAAFVGKPFTLDGLLRKVRETLERPAA